MRRFCLVSAILLISISGFGADNLRLNQGLDYSSDSLDGPLITGDHMQDGAVQGKPNYVIIYGEGCYNSKRQARRTVSLWDKYRGRVNFVIVDLDRYQSRAQQELAKKYYHGSIPHVVVLDKMGRAVYDSSGEVEESRISSLFDKLLQ